MTIGSRTAQAFDHDVKPKRGCWLPDFQDVKRHLRRHLRLLVVLQNPVGVEGGRVVHLLHVRSRFRTLEEEEEEEFRKSKVGIYP